jgi:ABC-type phosphate transport system ATPase subunit
MAFFLMGKLLESGDSDTLFKNPTRSETREYLDGVYG